MRTLIQIAFYLALMQMYLTLGCPPLLMVGMWRQP